MICPYCNTRNDPGFQFCLNCGKQLVQGEAAPVGANRGLWLDTVRLVVMLFALWIARAILVALPFVREVNIPNFPLRVPDLISLVIYLGIIFLLVTYAASFPRLWRAAYPRFSSAAGVITALIYLFLLGQIYRAVQPLIAQLNLIPEALALVQVLLLVFALALVLRALLILNRELPGWLSRLTSDAQPEPVIPPAAEHALLKPETPAA